MLVSVAYRVTRRVLSSVAVLLRREVSKDAELLVLQHENAVLRRQIRRVRYEPADRFWFAALSSLQHHSVRHAAERMKDTMPGNAETAKRQTIENTDSRP